MDSVLQSVYSLSFQKSLKVAILVLVDSVLQSMKNEIVEIIDVGRNPCFSGQCFAIQ